MYTVLRRYRVRLGTIADTAARAEETLVPSLKEVPGFVAYHLLHTGDNTVAALVLFETKAGADAGARTLSDWFRSDWPAFRLIAPELSVAELLTLDEASGRAALEPQWTDDRALLAPPTDALSARALGAGRQVRERRRGLERRVAVIAIAEDRRSGVERRTDLDRRSGLERRGEVISAESAAPVEPRRIAPPWRRREPSHTR
jgi:heme-degrading monooxygenase HmoA